MLVPSFAVLSGSQVRRVLHGRERQVIEIVDAAYRTHGAGSAPTGGAGEAILVLKQGDTGHPFACMENLTIRAVRTAALTVLAAGWLSRNRGRARLGFVGLGRVARYVHTYLTATGWRFDEVHAYDPAGQRATAFRSYVERRGGRVDLSSGIRNVIASSDLVVFATSADGAHVHDPAWFGHNPVVLQISRRDLAPEVMRSAANFADDVHLSGRTLYDVMTGSVDVPADRPAVFTPFGVADLDVAVGQHVYNEVRASGTLSVVDDFFADGILL
ncbi:ornithine cyclodeaminase [Kibdelosporangium banguiense]|uniref:Ornithine cyclodeaminase n=1 Tax=Kibdelosporangium banguiense TaxID=1365924 RepID=A0ABS4TLI3_9PSEU|nr:2,3-diaminopropionate biosynthesis protein SbnB [Kibdelosporangium banguiense]MBP2325292.1 ornithine cyclodeaminase [Kibdelosporangium banguiense]